MLDKQERSGIMFSINRLSIKKRGQILHLLVEGNSLRATARIADCSLNTVTKLLRDVGEACLEYQDKTLKNLPCKRVQVDEIWSFCYAKDKNVPVEKQDQPGYGDVWTWVAICADTKLVASWQVGDRNMEAATLFMNDLGGRLKNRVQLTSDGLNLYINAVESVFAGEIDYAMLKKVYGEPKQKETRYSPTEFVCASKRKITGNPDLKDVPTSYVERQNLTMRMGMRRFTRLTNAFSKKIENHIHAVSLHYMYYNFGRIHKSLRVTPAQEAGLSAHIWSLEEIAGLVKDEPPRKRGPYRKNNSN